MRSAPSGLSPDDGASFERARPQEPRQSALVEDAESRLSRLLLHPHAETKGTLCVRSSKTPHTCGCLPALRVPSIRRIMMNFCSGARPRRARRSRNAACYARPRSAESPLLGHSPLQGRAPLVGPGTARRASHVPGPPRTRLRRSFREHGLRAHGPRQRDVVTSHALRSGLLIGGALRRLRGDIGVRS